MRLIIDRFEGGYAVCEDENRKMINIDKGKLPPEAKEGDVLSDARGGIIVDAAETEARKRKMRNITDDLF